MGHRLRRLAAWFGLGPHRRAASPAILPPPRTGITLDGIDLTRAVGVGGAYRAIQVITTGIAQLPMRAEKAGVEIPAYGIVQRPCLSMGRRAWVEATVMSLVVDGNAFWRTLRDTDGRVIDVQPLNPHTVTVATDPTTGQPRYSHGSKTYTADDITHLTVMRLPGATRGIGPITAARRGLSFAAAASDYTAGWFDTTGQPAGVLTTSEHLTAADATTYRNLWNGLDADGAPLEATANPSRVKVLGGGLVYEPLMLRPADALWLEAQQFTTVEIARIFGVPSTLMLVGVEGGSRTYANVEQEWIAFTRFTLMAYISAIEEAMSGLIARAHSVRFDIDVLLRSDTTTRYSAYTAAITAGWLTPNEVRAIEGLPPLEGPTTP